MGRVQVPAHNAVATAQVESAAYEGMLKRLRAYNSLETDFQSKLKESTQSQTKLAHRCLLAAKNAALVAECILFSSAVMQHLCLKKRKT